MTMNLLLPLACLLLVDLTLKLLLASGVAARIAVDLPNERSLHARPVPRIGGIVLVTVALAAAAFADALLWPLLAIAAALALLSAWDDRHGLPVPVRLVIHLVAAIGAALLLLGREVVWAIAVATLLLTWMMNLYNFMDGSDGLAGGMALVGFGALGAAAATGGAPALAVACLCVAGAAAGFLRHNFHPARVFLGDAGSIPLGFLAGALGMHGWVQGVWPAWFPPLVFSPFVVDASLTLAARVLRGEKPWRAHREHAYQRMVAGGLGHRRTALAWYALMAACSGSGLVGLRLSDDAQAVLLLGWLVAYGILVVVTTRQYPLRRVC